jgi:flagellar biosynthesis protein FlhB
MLSRTEPASPRQLQRAREAGDHPRSAILRLGLVWAVGMCVLPSAVGSLWNYGRLQIQRAIQARHTEPLDLVVTAHHELSHALSLSLPLLAVLLVADLALHVAENRGLTFSPVARSKPGARLAELFSVRSLTLLGLQWLAMCALAAYGSHWWRSHVHDVAANLANTYGAQQLSAVTVLHFAWVAGFIWCVCGCVDWVLARRTWLQQLKMSRAEKQQEQREAEGDPWLVLHRQQLSQESLTETVVGTVQNATLVIHAGFELAVLLRYVPDQDSAPRILGAATGATARKVLDDALSADVPSAEAPALARVLARRSAGSPISEAQYEEVASLLGSLSAARASSLDAKLSLRR